MIESGQTEAIHTMEFIHANTNCDKISLDIIYVLQQLDIELERCPEDIKRMAIVHTIR